MIKFMLTMLKMTMLKTNDVVVNSEYENRLRHRQNTEVVPVTILGWRVDSKAPVNPDFSIYHKCYDFQKLGPVKKTFLL